MDLENIFPLETVQTALLPKVIYVDDSIPYSLRDAPQKSSQRFFEYRKDFQTHYGSLSGKNSLRHMGNGVQKAARVSRSGRREKFDKVLAKNKRGHRKLRRSFC